MSIRVKNLLERLIYNGYIHMHCAYMTQRIQNDEPITFQVACEVKERQESMDEEMNALAENDTWALTPFPNENKAIWM